MRFFLKFLLSFSLITLGILALTGYVALFHYLAGNVHEIFGAVGIFLPFVTIASVIIAAD